MIKSSVLFTQFLRRRRASVAASTKLPFVLQTKLRLPRGFKKLFDTFLSARGIVGSSARLLFRGETVIEQVDEVEEDAVLFRHELEYTCSRRSWCGSRRSCGRQGQAGNRAARARNGGVWENIFRAAVECASSYGQETVLSHQSGSCRESHILFAWLLLLSRLPEHARDALLVVAMATVA